MTFKLKDPGSAITHFIGMMMALLATIPLLVKAAREPDWLHLIALSVFALSMFLLYTASTTYHSLDISAKVNRRLQKVDHMMIFVLIAGSYTPICLIALKGHTGKLLCILVWSGTGWNHRESLLDHLPEVVFFRDLHRHGMAVCAGILPDLSRTVQTGFRMASRRRHYLYDRRYYLCTESADFQCKA